MAQCEGKWRMAEHTRRPAPSVPASVIFIRYFPFILFQCRTRSRSASRGPRVGNGRERPDHCSGSASMTIIPGILTYWRAPEEDTMSRFFGSLAAFLLVVTPLHAGELDDESAPKAAPRSPA